MDIDQPGEPVARDLIRWMLGMHPSSRVCPREIFDNIVDWLPMPSQLALSTTNRALRTEVLPVFNGWVWRQPTMALTRMMVQGRMQWPFLAQAAETAANGHVACPWCRTLHDPVATVDWDAYPGGLEYVCRTTPRDNYEANHQRLVSLYERPAAWHPIVLTGFVRQTMMGRNPRHLREEAELDRHLHQFRRQVTLEDGTASTEVFAEEEWKVIWQPSHGLFVRWRVDEVLTPGVDAGSIDIPCCPCEKNRKVVTYESLFDENFTEALYTSFDSGVQGVNPVEEDMLSEDGRRSPMLVVGPVRGCAYCGIDWQAAWRLRDEKEGGVLCWTTWFFLGKPTGVPEMLQAVADRRDRVNPDSVPILGIGNVARLSGLVDDYM